MSTNHDHKECEHAEMAYCAPCAKPYCKKCGKEWAVPCTQAHFNWQYQPNSWWTHKSPYISYFTAGGTGINTATAAAANQLTYTSHDHKS